MSSRWGLALGLGLGATVLCGHGVASAAPDSESGSGATVSASARPVRAAAVRALANPPRRVPRAVRTAPAAGAVRPAGAAGSVTPAPRPRRTAVPSVTVDIPPMPVSKTRAFEVSQPAITEAATVYVAAGGDPADSPRFFFGDLATSSLDRLASEKLSRERVRVEMGNLAVSGYFGGIWLRDNLRAAPDGPVRAGSPPPGGVVSALGLRMFSGLAGGLSGLSRAPLLSKPAAHASVPVLLTLYGYNKGYLEYVLDNPPPGVPSMRDTLTCNGFLDCNSSLVDLEIANRYDGALVDLAHPPTLRWAQMKAWSRVLELTTGLGRFVWQIIGAQGFSPTSYTALVDLSSAYLMIGKAATLASMQGWAGRDTDVASTALLLQAGLWMWSGSYFSGLASNAPRGTIPSIVVS
ncbi:MAG: hypothetical protein ACKOQ4_05370 [Mycobacterium sp.]